MKHYLPILLAVLTLITVTAAINASCEKESKVESTYSGPLEPPFNEILPTAKNLNIDLFLGGYRTSEYAQYCSDGSKLHWRFIGNEDSFTVPDENIEVNPVYLVMSIRVYPNEEQALEAIQEEKHSKRWNENRNEYYAKWIELPAEDIVGYTHFWKEPGDNPIQGREEMYFRIEQYVCRYSVELDNPPRLEDGCFIPPYLIDLLKFAVWETDINALNLFQAK
jgi:hypothetical protein